MIAASYSEACATPVTTGSSRFAVRALYGKELFSV